MRRATISEYDKLTNSLCNHVGIMNFRLMNICIKADPVSLVAVEVNIEGETKNIESVCQVGKEDDYRLMLFPSYDEDIPAIMAAVAVTHPEFKQEVESMSVGVADKTGVEKPYDVKYIRLTMPEVDDDRYEAYKDLAKLIYDDCKLQMEASEAKTDLLIAPQALLETKEDQEIIKEELKKLKEEWHAKRDKIYQGKVKEIDDAYTKWLSKMGKQEIGNMEDEDAKSIPEGLKLSDIIE